MNPHLMRDILARYVEMEFPTSPVMLDSVLHGKSVAGLPAEAERFRANQRRFLDGELLIVDNRGTRQVYGTRKVNIDTLKPI